MQRRTVQILLAGIVMGIALSGLLHHASTKQAEKRGEDGQKVEVLDGTGTYVDNDALWTVLAGEWRSADGRWMLTFHEDDRMTLTLDGETAVESELSLTYLRPGETAATELDADSPKMEDENGEIASLVHEGAASSTGVVVMTVQYENGGTETVRFEKIEEQEET